MKHPTKALLSILLALLLCGLTPAFAEEPPAPAGDTAEAADAIPVIFLSGFGTQLYLHDGEPGAVPLLALDTKAWLGALAATTLDALRNPLAVLFSPNHLADALAAYAMNLLGRLACDENGDSLHPVANTSRNRDEPHDRQIGGGQELPMHEFHFDWRLDPMATARDLDVFVQQVKAKTGSEKVHFYALSFGSVLACAYLAQYGTKDLESLFLAFSAHGGLQLAKDLIQMKFQISGQGLAAFLAEMVPQNTWVSRSLAWLIRSLEWLFRLLEWPANLVLQRVRDRLYERCILPLLGQMPAAWAFVTDDATYEAAKALLLSGTDRYAGLIAKIDAYHYSAGNRTNEILRQAASEIKVGLVCGYDRAPIPLGGTFLYQSDFMIATTDASGGAICADYGKTLPVGYTQARQACGHGHISPDRVIDASTCALPEQTWFVKGCPHTYVYDGTGMYYWFLAYEGQPTVWSSEEFPQFR